MHVDDPAPGAGPAPAPARPPAPPHAVARLRDACLAGNPWIPRLDRGGPRKDRCAGCRLVPAHCMCASPANVPTRAGICLLMGEFEALKPSNTGWLVADVVPDTHAFEWSRTRVEAPLLALLDDPGWQPMVVFPAEFAPPERVITGLVPDTARRPLFILLDGTWAEARKAFRKSPWLDRFPVLALGGGGRSRYQLRQASHAHHLCTSEVAARCLEMAGDRRAAQALTDTLEVFNQRSLLSRFGRQGA